MTYAGAHYHQIKSWLKLGGWEGSKYSGGVSQWLGFSPEGLTCCGSDPYAIAPLIVLQGNRREVLTASMAPARVAVYSLGARDVGEGIGVDARHDVGSPWALGWRGTKTCFESLLPLLLHDE